MSSTGLGNGLFTKFAYVLRLDTGYKFTSVLEPAHLFMFILACVLGDEVEGRR